MPDLRVGGHIAAFTSAQAGSLLGQLYIQHPYPPTQQVNLLSIFEIKICRFNRKTMSRFLEATSSKQTSKKNWDFVHILRHVARKCTTQ